MGNRKCIAQRIVRYSFSPFRLWRCGSWRGSDRGFTVRGAPWTKRRMQDFGFILAATLSMLGIIIGFSFSMATNRYDQRKNYEEAEANAIGKEYVRLTFCLPRMCNRSCAA